MLQVLIHYVQWNSRHDEWIACDSPRLRVPLRTSGRHDSGGVGGNVAGGGGGATNPKNGGSSSADGSHGDAAAHNSKTTVTPVSGGSGAKDFKSGEMVMATWKLNRKFAAKVMIKMPVSSVLLRLDKYHRRSQIFAVSFADVSGVFVSFIALILDGRCPFWLLEGMLRG